MAVAEHALIRTTIQIVMKRLSCLLPLLLVAVLSAAPALPPQGTAAVSAFLKSATDRGDVPGVVVAVVNKDGLIYNEAFGKSSTLGNTPMAKDTIFNMASMTKPITSVAIMMLVDEGKLKLDDDVAKYLPKYKNLLVITNYNAADASYQTRPAKGPITIRQSADPHVRLQLRLLQPDADEDHAEDRQDRTGPAAAIRPGHQLAVRTQHPACSARSSKPSRSRRSTRSSRRASWDRSA